MNRSLAYGRSIEALDVVLIQDNRGSQAILRSMIASFRVRRLRVYDRADHALKDMMVDPPSVAVTDWDMKPMSGYRLTSMIRARGMEPLSFLPVIVVVGGATMTLIDRAFTAGANSILVKPVAPVVMRRRLEWIAQDERVFVTRGDSYVLDGMEEILEERVRRTDLADVMRRQKAMQEAMARRAADAQDIVDEIVSGGTTEPQSQPETDSSSRPPRQSHETWHSWTMS